MINEEICYEIMKNNNNIDSDGGFYGRYYGTSGSGITNKVLDGLLCFECGCCYHFGGNRQVNLEGKV